MSNNLIALVALQRLAAERLALANAQSILNNEPLYKA
jgi:hypothetical protein